jgi:SAM-dependent methyltransferase
VKEAVAEHLPGDGLTLADVSTRSRILDVGCGSGRFLLTLSGAGFRNLQGVDRYVERDIEYPGGLRILKGSLDDCQGEWDIIMFHHSFEHLPHPLETLKTATGLLAPNGTIVVRIPVVSSYAWERYGVTWVQLDAPRHFFLHSRKSMWRLAEAAGLSVDRVVDDSTEFQFLGSELYVRDIPLRSEGTLGLDAKGSIFSLEEVQAFRRLAAELNVKGRGDQAAFYLKKA